VILALDVGNSNIYGGLFDGRGTLKFQFRKNSKGGATSDELGLFLCGILRENGIEPSSIERIAICSVVPEVVHSLKNCCRKYFSGTPFILEPGVRTGLKVKYRNPHELGADRIANCIAVTQLYPNRDAVVIDFGTATTFCVVTAEKDYLGGSILAGLRISMEALELKTARLPTVEIVRPASVIGRSTVENIQSGLYYGTIGMVKEFTSRIAEEAFGGRRPLVIGTGGFASLFDRAGIFDESVPDLVLKGLYLALQMNSEAPGLSRSNSLAGGAAAALS
jgi:type III pantothenate kinase